MISVPRLALVCVLFALPLEVGAQNIGATLQGLVSDEQRELLAKLYKSIISDGKWVEELRTSPARDRFLAGRSDFGDLGIPVPADYQLYLKMGRFRNALVVAPYVELLVQTLMRVAAGKETRVIINLPPRHLKSGDARRQPQQACGITCDHITEVVHAENAIGSIWWK